MTRSIEIQIEGLTAELIRMLMEHYGWDIMQAMDELYRSTTFKKLNDPSTGLYYQSAVYVFDYLQNELSTGILS